MDLSTSYPSRDPDYQSKEDLRENRQRKKKKERKKKKKKSMTLPTVPSHLGHQLPSSTALDNEGCSKAVPSSHEN